MRTFLTMLTSVCICGTAVAETPFGNDVRSRPNPATEKRKAPIVAEWDLKMLSKDFAIVGRRYDAVKNRMIWELEAKKDVAGPALQASFMDGDRVLQARRNLAFSPAQAMYEKGARLQAILPLPEDKSCKETARVVLRNAKNSSSERN